MLRSVAAAAAGLLAAARSRAQGGPPPHPLPDLGQVAGVLDHFTGVLEQAVEELAIVGARAELVGLLLLLADGKGGIVAHVVENVAAATLDEVLGQLFAVFAVLITGKVRGQAREIRPEQGEQRAEPLRVPAVWRRRHQDQVLQALTGERLDELVPLLAGGGASSGLRGVGAGVSLVDDDQLRARPDEVVATVIGLDVVERDDREVEDVEDGAVPADPVEPAGGAGEDELGVDVKLVLELGLPLLGEVGRAEDREAPDLAAVQQLAGDEQALDCLADADVVGNEQPDRVQLQGHQERHKLVGPWLDGDLAEGTERAGTGPEAQTDRVAEQPAGLVVAQVSRVGRGEVRGPDLLNFRIDPGDLHVGAARGAGQRGSPPATRAGPPTRGFVP